MCICSCVSMCVCVCEESILLSFFFGSSFCCLPLVIFRCFGFPASYLASLRSFKLKTPSVLWPSQDFGRGRVCICVGVCVWDKVFHVVNGSVCLAACFPSFAFHFFHLFFPVNMKNSRLIESYLFLLRSHIDSQIYICIYICFICVYMGIYVRALA